MTTLPFPVPSPPAPASIHIVCAGQPIAWARAGSSGTRRYTPAHVRRWQQYITLEARLAMAGRPPLSGPVAVTVTAFMPIGSSWSKKRQRAAMQGDLRPCGRPDLDNLGKAATDAINRIAYLDDAQIVDLRIQKRYHDEHGGPRLEITVTPLCEKKGAEGAAPVR